MRTVEPMFKNFDKDDSGSIDRGSLSLLAPIFLQCSIIAFRTATLLVS